MGYAHFKPHIYFKIFELHSDFTPWFAILASQAFATKERNQKQNTTYNAKCCNVDLLFVFFDHLPTYF